MQFTFITACRSGTGLLPTQPHGRAVVSAFHIEWHNYMDVTFTHLDVCPRGHTTASKRRVRTGFFSAVFFRRGLDLPTAGKEHQSRAGFDEQP